MTHCLLVDDDAGIRDSLGHYLRSFGFRVTLAESAAAMRQALTAASDIDIILLDLMLPDGDGLALCQSVQSSSAIPVIILTARGDVGSRVLGLEWGADDYLSKPFEPRELVARIHALLRRQQRLEQGTRARTEGASVSFSGWRFDLIRHLLRDPAGVVIPLSSAEFRLLAALAAHPNRVLSRDRLIELTRAPGVDVNDRSIDLGISRLRKKLRDDKEGQLIRTIRGEGYLFNPEGSS